MADLTRTERDLLRLLRFRENMGPQYLASASRGRRTLIVPQLHTSRRGRLRAFNDSTVTGLARRGLIEVKAEWVYLGGYDGRRHLESTDGQSVVLTDAGRAAVGGEGRGACGAGS